MTDHRKLGVDLFNSVWTFIEKRDRSPEEVDRMIHAAHASRYHWGEVGAPVNLARGEWQISRVYAILGRSEPAAWHAKRCLEICRANGIEDFDLAYAYEALARAAAVAGNRTESDRYLQEARACKIRETDDREQFERDLASLP